MPVELPSQENSVTIARAIARASREIARRRARDAWHGKKNRTRRVAMLDVRRSALRVERFSVALRVGDTRVATRSVRRSNPAVHDTER